MNLSPLPIQKFFDNDGRPLVGGLLFTYRAGTTTKVATYIDSTGGTPNTNPIVLDFRGECRLWIDPALAYKFVLSPPGDTDPPTKPIWSVDNITVGAAPADNAAVDTGTVNNIALAIPLITAPVAFTRIVFQASHTNTGPVTISINGGPSKRLLWQNFGELGGGEIQTFGIYQAIYDGAQWQLQGPTLDPTQLRTDAEIAAGVTPTDYAWPESTPERYGAVGDGIVNDFQAFANALAVNKAGGQKVQARMRTYKINSGFSFDPYFHYLDLGGATLDFSSVLSGAAFKTVSTTPITNTDLVAGTITRGIYNGRIVGGARAGVLAFDLDQSADVTKSAVFLQFDHLSVVEFLDHLRIFSVVVEPCFTHCTFVHPPASTGTVVFIPSGGSNYGERINFIDCAFLGNDLICNNQEPNAICHFVSCSFDYPGKQMLRVRSGATILADMCHFENSFDTNYWFDASGDNSTIIIQESMIVVTGARSSFPIGFSDASIAGGGGIQLLDCKLAISLGSTYSQDYLIAGTGRVVIRNLSLLPLSPVASPSQSGNSIWNYTFASADLTEYQLAGTSAPTRDTTTGHDDSNSLKFNPGAGQTSTMSVVRDCKPGEMPVFGFYWKATGLSVGNPALVTVLFYDADFAQTRNASIGGGAGILTLITNPGAFTRERLQLQVFAPPGTRYVLFQLSLPAGTARTFWADEISLPYS